MLNVLFDIMPLFVVRFFAKRLCERIPVGKATYVTARPDVLVKLDK